jgi:hypothetical protein
MSAIPDWGNVPLVTPSPEVRVSLSFMDGVRFGLGLAVAWLVLVPVAAIVIVFVLAQAR